MPKHFPSIFFGLIAAGAVLPAYACIIEGDGMEEAARYRADQARLVGPAAVAADLIVIAKALRWAEKNGWETEFEVKRVLKGSVPIGAKVRYKSSLSVVEMPCTPAKDTFHNTDVIPGDQYLLYVAGTRLLRAASTVRGSLRLSLDDEIGLIARATASNKSLERTRDE